MVAATLGSVAGSENVLAGPVCRGGWAWDGSIGSLAQNTSPRSLSSPPVACVAVRAAAHFQSLFGDTEWWSQ